MDNTKRCVSNQTWIIRTETAVLVIVDCVGSSSSWLEHATIANIATVTKEKIRSFFGTPVKTCV